MSEARPSAINDAELVELLKKLSLLPKEAEPQEAGSSAVIENYELEITKITRRLITWGSAGGAGAGVIGAVLAAINKSDSTLAVTIAATAVVIASGLLALARVMDGDVRGRASAGTAAVEARGVVVRAWVETHKAVDDGKASPAASQLSDRASKPTESQLLLTLAQYGNQLNVTTDQGVSPVTGVRWTVGQGLEVKLTYGETDWVKGSEVTAFTASTN